MRIRFWRRPEPTYVLRPKSAIAILEYDLYGIPPEPGTTAAAILAIRLLAGHQPPTPAADESTPDLH